MFLYLIYIINDTITHMLVGILEMINYGYINAQIYKGKKRIIETLAFQLVLYYF